MTLETLEMTVGQLVAEKPARSRVFERHGIDFCCGGKRPLAEACAKHGISADVLIADLAEVDAAREEGPNPADMGLAELADHIVQTHHAYLREELPRLNRMAARVAEVHGGKDARLAEIARVLQQLSAELTMHMAKEERVLFPVIRALDGSDTLPAMQFGALSYPIHAMEYEHDSAGNDLEQLRILSDGHTPPDWACNTYRALLDGLHELERDLHLHIHKENNILFPRALECEARLQ